MLRHRKAFVLRALQLQSTHITSSSTRYPRILCRSLRSKAAPPLHRLAGISAHQLVVPRSPHCATGAPTILGAAYSQTSVSERVFRELVPSDSQRRTIYALSTPLGKAGVAVVRISGPEAWDVWRSVVRTYASAKAKGKERESEPEPWKMNRCKVVHPTTEELLDDGLAVFFKGTYELCSRNRQYKWVLNNTHFFSTEIIHDGGCC